jgi:hypothetical protein
MKKQLKRFLADFVVWLARRYRDRSLSVARFKLAECLLQGVELTRRSIIGLVGMVVLVGVMTVGLVVAIIAAVYVLCPWDLTAPHRILLGGVLCFGVPAIAVAIGTSSRVWMRGVMACPVIGPFIRKTLDEAEGGSAPPRH